MDSFFKINGGTVSARELQVSVLGLGAIGGKVAELLAKGAVPGMSLYSVSARNLNKAKMFFQNCQSTPYVLSLDEAIDSADVVVECLPPDLFNDVANKTLRQGKVLVPCSIGGVFKNPALIDLARQHSAHLFLPCGALAGLDGVGAASLAGVKYATLKTEKSAESFGQNKFLEDIGFDTSSLSSPECVYRGGVSEAIKFFPKNINVAAALCLAGIDEELLSVELWACPGLQVNRHTVSIQSKAGSLNLVMENKPDPKNPKTSMITPYSVISTLSKISSSISF